MTIQLVKNFYLVSFCR